MWAAAATRTLQGSGLPGERRDEQDRRTLGTAAHPAQWARDEHAAFQPLGRRPAAGRRADRPGSREAHEQPPAGTARPRAAGSFWGPLFPLSSRDGQKAFLSVGLETSNDSAVKLRRKQGCPRLPAQPGPTRGVGAERPHTPPCLRGDTGPTTNSQRRCQPTRLQDPYVSGA